MTLLAREVRLKHNRAATPSMVMIGAQTIRGGRAGPTIREPGGRCGRTVGTKRTRGGVAVAQERLGMGFPRR